MMRWLIGLILIALGLSFLFEINIFKFIIPVIFIWFGWMIISKDHNYHGYSEGKSVDADSLNEVYIFSGTRKKIKTSDFTGGKMVAIFGGMELDLSDVKTKEKTIRLETVAVFGGISLSVPKNWEVDAVGMSAVLGGFDNKTDPETKKDVKLIISGAAVFGGVEVH